jgi:serine/threonine protein kinase
MLKIADFGTAIFFNENIKLTDFVGTAYYMAP